MTTTRPSRCTRVAAVYIAVLAVSMLVVVAGVAAIYAANTALARATVMGDIREAEFAARSGVELARLKANLDQSWRDPNASTTWWTRQAIGAGDTSVRVDDPGDGAVSDNLYDDLRITSIGACGDARHTVEVTLTAAPTPLDVLSFALHTSGGMRVNSGLTITAVGAPLSASGAFRNDGTVVGDVQAGSISRAGTVTGSLTVNASSKPFPTTDTAELYAARGTTLAVTQLRDVVLTAASNPYGAANADGVYVVRSSSDFTIASAAIIGTLVIIAPGRKIAIGDGVVIMPHRPDYPSLLVVGDVRVEDTGTALPNGYASEIIKGLVHVRGTVEFVDDPKISGVWLIESNGSDAVRFSASLTATFDPTIAANPPEGYAARVDMTIQSGSWRRVTD